MKEKLIKILLSLSCFAVFTSFGYDLALTGDAIVCAGDSRFYSMSGALTWDYPDDYSYAVDHFYAWEVEQGEFAFPDTDEWQEDITTASVTWEDACTTGKITAKHKLIYKDTDGNTKEYIFTEEMEVSIKKLSSSISISGVTMIECGTVDRYVYTSTESCADEYIWTVPTGWTIISGQGTKTLTVECDELTGGIISVNANLLCSGFLSTITSSITVVRDCPPNAEYLVGTSSLPEHTSVDDYILVDPDPTSGTVKVNFGQTVKFKAGYEIIIKPTFRVKPGAYFHAKIGPCVSCTADKNHVGINEEELIATSMVYPNPTHGEFNLTWSSEIKGEVTIEIYSVGGQLIHQVSTMHNEYTVDINDHSDGIYIVKIVTKSGNIFTTKLVKK